MQERNNVRLSSSFSFKRVTGPPSTSASSAAIALVKGMRYELVPMKSVEAGIADLPAGCSVSVTCSPAKGLPATFELSARLLERGHHVVPHIAARLVTGPQHAAEIASWFRTHGLHEMFLVGGDAPHPVGQYHDATSFLRDLLDTDHGLTHIGVTAYPDGHALIAPGSLHEALHAKQQLLSAAGIIGHATTQMCFDAAQIRSWLGAERAAGLTMAVHLGIPGVIDRAKLLTMGMRLGIGNSMRFVKKNGGTLGRLFSPAGYDPAKLVIPIAAQADELGIDGLHSFTFNNVGATALWQRTFTARTVTNGTRSSW